MIETTETELKPKAYETSAEGVTFFAAGRVARPPRIFSKLKLELALLKRGKLAALDAFLDGTELAGSGFKLRRFYDLANELREDDANFAPYLAAAKAALGVADVEAEAILEEGIAE